MFNIDNDQILSAYKKVICPGIITEASETKLAFNGQEFIVGNIYKTISTISGEYRGQKVNTKPFVFKIIAIESGYYWKPDAEDIIPSDYWKYSGSWAAKVNAMKVQILKSSDYQRGDIKWMIIEPNLIKNDKRNKNISDRLEISSISNTNPFTLGYFAKNGKLRVSVGPTKIETFPSQFYAITGVDLETFRGHGFYEEESKDKKWSMGITLTIPRKDIELLNIPVATVLGENNTIDINNLDYGIGLLSLGFLPGRNDKNFDRITKDMSEEDKKQFYKGTEVK